MTNSYSLEYGFSPNSGDKAVRVESFYQPETTEPPTPLDDPSIQS